MYQNFQSRLMKEITNTNNIHHFNFGLVIIIVRTFGVKILFKEHFDFKFGIMDQFAYIDKCHWGWTRKKNPRSCQQQNKNEFAIKIFSQSESQKGVQTHNNNAQSQANFKRNFYIRTSWCAFMFHHHRPILICLYC